MEIILILVVLIGLVIIFKEQLTSLVKIFFQRSRNRAIQSEKQSGINPEAGNEILGKGGYLL